MKSSRREFLQTAAGGVTATWSGLQIFAGPQAQAQSEAPDHSRRKQDFFVYGSAFYRPPNPPASERRAMLKTIAKEYKFNIIRIYSPWPYLNPKEGVFDFAELEEVMSYCDEFGLKVLMGVILEDAPYWLEMAHPETRYVNANDHAEKLDGSGNNVSGGWPGLCLDWQPVRDAAGKFIREMAKTLVKHPSMYAYDCWNEPHIEPAWGHHFSETTDDLLYCYCPATAAAFQRWLEKRYGTLDNLNQAWVRRYPSFAAIVPPRDSGTYLDWIDWRRFIIDRSTDEMRFRAANIRAEDPKSILESHAAIQNAVESCAIYGINTWRLAEVMETWGLSNFPRLSMFPVYEGVARLEVTRANAGDKPFWMTELEGGQGGSGLERSRNMRPRDIRFWNWMAVATGSKGTIHWCYHTEATGWEAGGFGLVARDGSATERVLEAADDCRLLKAHWGIIRDYRPKTDVAILYDQDNALLTFAMSGDEGASTKSFRGYYKALWNTDLWADFVELKSLAKNHYRVIIAPWHLIGKKETIDALRSFVENGGTLLIETGFGMFDERMFFNPAIPPYGLADAFGYREGDNFYMERNDPSDLSKLPEMPASERVYVDGHLQFSEPIPVKVRAHTYLTPITVTSATVIAKYEDIPVAAMKKVGQGQVYYFGTNLGASIQAGSEEGMQLVQAILRGTVQQTVTADKLRPRLIEGEQRSLLLVFNDGISDQTSSVTVPHRYTSATNLYTNQKQMVNENSVQVTVPFQDVSVIRLE
jgi:beta-galactosidase